MDKSEVLAGRGVDFESVDGRLDSLYFVPELHARQYMTSPRRLILSQSITMARRTWHPQNVRAQISLDAYFMKPSVNGHQIRVNHRFSKIDRIRRRNRPL